MPIWFQWILSAIILVGIIVWLAVGNFCDGVLGVDAPVDSYLVPISSGVLAYIAAFGFFSLPMKTVFRELLPLFVMMINVAIFASQGALLPFVIGTCAPSFFIILMVFNSALQATHKGAGVADYDYSRYRGYLAFVLCVGNGSVNAIAWCIEHKWGGSKAVRWILGCFVPPLVLLIPAAINMAKGKPNGQYNVPDNSTFWRLYISSRLGIYFCMYFFVHYHFEAMIIKELSDRIFQELN
jgi:hypothetical protein